MEPDLEKASSLPLSRKDRERLQRRQIILEAACSVFAEKGYARATLEDIAFRAEFGKGTLYNYFSKGKEGLLFAIFDQLFDEMEQLIMDSFSDERTREFPFRDLMLAFINRCLAFFYDQKDLFMILIKEAYRMSFGDNLERSSYFRQQHERITEALALPIHEAIERGDIRPLPPKAVAHLILGNIEGMQVHAMLTSDTGCADQTMIPKRAEAANFLTTMLMDGLLNE